MNREEALKLVKEKLTNKNLTKHSLAVEIVMRDLAEYFQEDPEIWGLAGLLHDLDYEKTAEDPEKHSVLTSEWLKEYDLPAEISQIILAHNSDRLNIERKTNAEKAIYAVDPLTGLIVAAALMQPDKKIRELSLNSAMKRFRASGFAKGANREHIKTCEDLGLSLEEFIGISLKAMQKIDKDLGL